MKRAEIVFGLIQIPLDFFMILLAGMAAYAVRFSPIVTKMRPVGFNLLFQDYLQFVAIGGVITIGFFALSGLYQLRITRFISREFPRIGVSLTAGLVAIAFYSFITANPFESRFIVLAWWISAIIFVLLGRNILKVIQQFLVKHYTIGIHNVVVIQNKNGREEIIKIRQQTGYRVLAELSGISIGRLRKYLKTHIVDDVFLADLSFHQEKVQELANFCHRMQINFCVIPSQISIFQSQLKTFPNGLVFLEVRHTPLDGWGKIIKRILDILGASIMSIVLLPLFLLIALAIKIDSRGPVLVKLRRVREGQREFSVYKFRSMIRDAHQLKQTQLRQLNERRDGPLFKIENDPRTTRVGKILRKFHLDEFGQLINVLRGEMSLVGPRPHEPEEVHQYKPHHLRVLSIKPGITGLPQISGAHRLTFEREVELDMYYIEHWSLWLDFYILLRTFFLVFTDTKGA